MIKNLGNSSINNNCSNICFNENIKIGNDSNECIVSCKDNGYDYEYNNIRFHHCPEYTYEIPNNKYVYLIVLAYMIR